MNHQKAMENCWTADEARAFLTVAQAEDPQTAALYTLALDSGARKGELCGLRWEDVDLKQGRITIVRQLTKSGMPPLFGKPKTSKPRTITLSPQTVMLLQRHKAHQAEIKLANRHHYHDYDLVFARNWTHLTRSGIVLGMPLPITQVGQQEFKHMIDRAGVRTITFHGMRHTCATLLLQARVQAHVVQERLGHKRIETTLGIYAHALPEMQQDAATKLAALIQP